MHLNSHNFHNWLLVKSMKTDFAKLSFCDFDSKFNCYVAAFFTGAVIYVAKNGKIRYVFQTIMKIVKWRCLLAEY